MKNDANPSAKANLKSHFEMRAPVLLRPSCVGVACGSVAMAGRMSNAVHLSSTHAMAQRNAAGLAKRLRPIRWTCAQTGPRVPRDVPSLAPMPGTLLQQQILHFPRLPDHLAWNIHARRNRGTPVLICRTQLPFFSPGYHPFF